MKVTVPLIKAGDQGNGDIIANEALNKFMEDYKKNPSLAIGELNHSAKVEDSILKMEFKDPPKEFIDAMNIFNWQRSWLRLADEIKNKNPKRPFWAIYDGSNQEVVKVFLDFIDAVNFINTEEKFGLVGIESPPKIIKLPKMIYLFCSKQTKTGYITLDKEEDNDDYSYFNDSEYYTCKRDNESNSWTPISKKVFKPITPNVYVEEKEVVWPQP